MNYRQFTKYDGWRPEFLYDIKYSSIVQMIYARIYIFFFYAPLSPPFPSRRILKSIRGTL